MGRGASKPMDIADKKPTPRVEPVVFNYALFKSMVAHFTEGALMTQNQPALDASRENYALHLGTSLRAMIQLMDDIDHSDESVDVSLLFPVLIQRLSQVRFHSLMLSHLLNWRDPSKMKMFAPICSEDEFKAFRQAFFCTLPDTLSVLPAEVVGGPIAGNHHPQIDPKFHGFLRAKDQLKLNVLSRGLFHKTRASVCERIYSQLLSCGSFKAKKFFTAFPNWSKSNAYWLEFSEGFFLKNFGSAIAFGDQDYAERFLQIDPSLLLKSSSFTDYSGRTFDCTAYEYAYWAKDTYMCRMLEKYMDPDIARKILKRIHDMERIDAVTGRLVGLTYRQNGQIYQSVHFDLNPLIQALRDYIEGYEAWYRAKDYQAMEAAWLKVGLAQRDVPAHVAQEYCRRDRSFDPTPAFNETAFPRALQFYNYETHSDAYYFPLKASGRGLGFDYALLRQSATWPGATRRPKAAFFSAENATVDLNAITRLEQVRTADLIESRRNLEEISNDALPSDFERDLRSLATLGMTDLGS